LLERGIGFAEELLRGFFLLGADDRKRSKFRRVVWFALTKLPPMLLPSRASGAYGLFRVDVRYLSHKDRDAFKRILCARREEIGAVIKRMESRSWYSDDAVLQNLRAAWHSLHAAVQALKATDGEPMRVHDARPKYPI
jgi:hypothetical protein